MSTPLLFTGMLLFVIMTVIAGAIIDSRYKRNKMKDMEYYLISGFVLLVYLLVSIVYIIS